ncbi:MAG: hypothetical protein UHC59_04430, partial [Fibrobacteraceae bacterium]|nr:hypothetical protein [Fibrobacteraceae bacterium]
QVWLVAGSHLGFAKKSSTARNDKKRRQKLRVTMQKNKIPRKTTFLNIKVHLKLSCNSVGQERGGLEGTVRPSQLRAGSPPKKMKKEIHY